MTGQTVVTGSYRALGLLGEGSAPTSAGSTDALTDLNRLVDALRLKKLLVYQVRKEPFTLVIGQATYTIGTAGADFLTDRPTKIEAATVTTSGIDTDVEIIAAERFARLPDKTTRGLPEFLWNNGALPVSTLSFVPVPNAAYALVLYTWRQLAAFVDLTTAYTAAPGYDEFLVMALARKLAPQHGVAWSDLLEGQYQDAKSAIMDLTLVDLRMEPEDLPFDQAQRSYVLSQDRYV